VAFAGREIARRCGVAPSGSHIQPVILGSDERAVAVAKALVAEGFDVRAVRPPTVPEGTARLRVSLTLNAGEDATSRLLDTLAAILARAPA
jgi:8-amino-7-oxononanoate synthase